jgi:hypothetical protein
MKTLFCCLLLIIGFTTLHAQPMRDLTVGNKFVYRIVQLIYPTVQSDTLPGIYYEQVIRDTVLDSKVYAVVYNSFERSTRFERSNDTAIYVWRNGKEEQLYSWNVKNGDLFKFTFLGLTYQSNVAETERVIVSNQPVLGFNLYYNNSSGFISITFVQRYGLTQASTYTRNIRREVDRNLIGVLIQGQVTGDTALYKTTSVITTTQQNATVQSPNPFTESMTMDYNLQQAASVQAVITTSDGKPVATLRQGLQSAGKQTLQWNGKADDGTVVAPGAYFISLRINEQRAADVKVIKMK